MNLNFLCCIGAEQKHDQSGMLKMNQVYFYRAYADETMSEILKDNFFNHSESHLKENDIILAYSPNEKDLPKVQWLRIVIPHAGLVKTEKVDNSYLLEVLRQDLADLGDQVQGIEEKIPGAASAANQLADKAFVNEIKTAIEITIAEINQEIDSLQETKQDVATALDHDNITNCITEIPQDIKLELNNGTLTLKAGSTYYTPNGVDTYTKTTTTADKTLTNTNNTRWAVFVNQAGNLQVWGLSALYSGTTAPSGASYPMWWDTTNNIIKISNDSGSTWEQQFSLPLCIITVSNGAISSIDQVFNGFGYIGSTIFTLPGVKGLVPDGRNEDGTLKNRIVNCTSVQTTTFTSAYSASLVVYNNGKLGAWGTIQYDPVKNITYNNSTPKANVAMIGKCTFDEGGRVTLFEPNQPFHAVDYNDFESTVEEINSSISAVDSSAVHKTGGTMSGTITSTVTNIIKRNVDNSYLEFYGGTSSSNAAFLRLDGKDSSSAGQFTLATSGGSSARKSLNGRPDGTLNWGGKPVVTTEAKSLAQNGYVKFNNGMIIQWGELAADSSGRYTVNFPTAFTSTNYTITAIGVSAGKITTYAYVQYGDKTTTYVQLATTADATHNGVRWLAIGY